MTTKFITENKEYIVEFSKKPTLFDAGYNNIITINFNNSIGLNIKSIKLTDIDIYKLIDTIEFAIAMNLDNSTFINGIDNISYIIQIYQEENANFNIFEYNGTNSKIYFQILEMKDVEHVIPILKFEITNTINEFLDILYELYKDDTPKLLVSNS